MGMTYLVYKRPPWPPDEDGTHSEEMPASTPEPQPYMSLGHVYKGRSSLADMTLNPRYHFEQYLVPGTPREIFRSMAHAAALSSLGDGTRSTVFLL